MIRRDSKALKIVIRAFVYTSSGKDRFKHFEADCSTVVVSRQSVKDVKFLTEKRGG